MKNYIFLCCLCYNECMNPSTGNGFDNVGFGISSGQGVGGDTALINSAFVGQKKNKKPIIVGLIVLLLIVVIILLVWLFGFGGLGNLRENKLRRSLNGYLNYVVLGEETDADFNLKELEREPYYTELNNTQMEQYLSVADIKFDNFEKFYYEDGGYEAIDFMKVYYQGFARLEMLEKDLGDKMSNIYSEFGTEGVIKAIKSDFGGVTGNVYLVDYANVLAKIDELKLIALEKAGNTNCLLDNSSSEMCKEVLQNEKTKNQDLLIELARIKESVSKIVKNIIYRMYDEKSII